MHEVKDMRLIHTALVAALALILSGCMENRGNKEIGGTLLGAAAGGLIGSQIGSGTGQLAAVGAGVLLGGLLGGEIGASLDRADQAYAAQSYQNALERNKIGERVAWSNPDSGNSGSYTPTRTYQASTGEYCREFQQTIVVGGRTESAYGTACRQPDGSWQVVN